MKISKSHVIFLKFSYITLTQCHFLVMYFSLSWIYQNYTVQIQYCADFIQAVVCLMHFFHVFANINIPSPICNHTNKQTDWMAFGFIANVTQTWVCITHKTFIQILSEVVRKKVKQKLFFAILDCKKHSIKKNTWEIFNKAVKEY